MTDKRSDDNAGLFAIKLEWLDKTKHADDPDAPFYFGPYPSKDAAEQALDFVRRYQDHDNEPDEERVTGVVVSYGPCADRCQPPALLRMFMAL